MGDMLYNEAKMTEVYNGLREQYGKLTSLADNDLPAAVNKLQSAWEENEGFGGFMQAKAKWDDQYDDIKRLINAIATEVDNSMVRAFQTDKTIGDGFGI